ncbi:hypothetical protein QLX08_009335 [Tetragonisca angustula]|uniref:Reverse transcriptase n=1 Tax=Tetragonisca angustula TaxID=166442 RepID=A0AAW0ZGM5_9HYME
MKKIRAKTLPTTITLEPQKLEKIVGELFPKAGPSVEKRDRVIRRQVNSETNINVELRELALAFQKKTKRSVTLGIDGIHGKKIFSVCAYFIPENVATIYSNCLEQGKFPKEWKTELILVPKPGKKDDNSASTYRPICLISEAEKVFEKIITERIWQHLDRTDPNISDR